MEKTEILDVPVSITTNEEILEYMKNAIEKNEKYSVIAINLNKIIAFHEKEQMEKVIKSFDCYIPDGVSVVKGCKELKSRITGVDLFQEICKNNKEIGAKIFLYGATQEIVDEAKIKLEEKYNGIQIVGIENGFIKDNDKLIEKINNSGANCVFVAMGSPRQEKWIYENKDKLNANVFMGVGGTFDVIAGKLKRAPLIFRKLGLEWLYRMLREPFKRLNNMPLQLKYWHLIKKQKRKRERLWKK